MNTINFTTRSTAEIVRKDLESRFPDTAFEVTVDMPIEPFGPALALVGLIVRWADGPTRVEVEDIVLRYQGLAWNPQTGVLEEHEHMEVTDGGELRRLRYGVDYVFVDGPDKE
jgi:hypothetical protein